MTQEQMDDVTERLQTASGTDLPRGLLQSLVRIAESAYSQGYEDGFRIGQKHIADVQGMIMDSMFKRKPPKGGASEGSG
jgi:hypothetical protein